MNKFYAKFSSNNPIHICRSAIISRGLAKINQPTPLRSKNSSLKPDRKVSSI